MVSATDVIAADLMALARSAPEGEPPSTARRPGTTATRLRGQGHEIREIRPFTEGDDLRHLDAAATARSGILQVRSFHEDRDRTLMLIADFRRPMLWGTRRLRSVDAAEALALAGWQAVRQRGAVGVAAITDAGVLSERPVARARGMARVAGCLERAHRLALASIARPVTDLAPPLAQAARAAPRGATIALATAFDQTGAGMQAVLGSILRRGALRILLPDDSLPPATLPALAADGTPLMADLSAAHARRAALVADLSRMGADVA